MVGGLLVTLILGVIDVLGWYFRKFFLGLEVFLCFFLILEGGGGGTVLELVMCEI